MSRTRFAQSTSNTGLTVRLPPGRPGVGVAMNTLMPRERASATQTRISAAAPLAAPFSPAGMSFSPSRSSTTSGLTVLSAER
jgi:hypothetical protein